MPDVLTGGQIPPGYSSVNPFAVVKGPGGAVPFIAFICTPSTAMACSSTLRCASVMPR
jgi:hypothetical protein